MMNVLTNRENISLLEFFPASCDLIKNLPILVAIILRLSNFVYDASL